MNEGVCRQDWTCSVNEMHGAKKHGRFIFVLLGIGWRFVGFVEISWRKNAENLLCSLSDMFFFSLDYSLRWESHSSFRECAITHKWKRRRRLRSENGALINQCMERCNKKKIDHTKEIDEMKHMNEWMNIFDIYTADIMMIESSFLLF